MAVQRVNVTLDPDLLEEFKKYAVKKGIGISPFLAAKMQEFIAEEQEFEEYKEKKRKGTL